MTNGDLPVPLHLAAALDGTGWHPASWREPDARPRELVTPDYWVDLISEAERGHLDFVTIQDALTLQPDGVQGRMDAVLIAARVAPRTRHIGLLPSAVATHTEPFHLSKAIATLDYVSSGRAGIQVEVTASAAAARHFGRRPAPESAQARYDEATDYVEVLRRLWDSWEDGAEIRDSATGRFIDRKKLHYIDFDGKWFSVKGPSITPRPPQGQPLVAALDDGEDSRRFIARSADIGFITPSNRGEVAGTVAAVHALRGDAPPVKIFADLLVFLDDTAERAAARRRRLDDQAGVEFTGDAAVFGGTPAQLADLVQDWHAAGVAGLRLRPATLPHDLLQITGGLAPELHRRGVFRGSYSTAERGDLRATLGLPRPANRYAPA
ncbi:MAG TPA: LLM class flavin-dependent oxidoreductase [Mycobacterium sp.]|nr:LLM class flavin-dependent oxidoreductase [Mycobacterium sp.]